MSRLSLHQTCRVGLSPRAAATPASLLGWVSCQVLQMDLLRCPVSEKGEFPRFFLGLMPGRLQVMDFLRLLGTSWQLRLYVWFGDERRASRTFRLPVSCSQSVLKSYLPFFRSL